MKLTINMPTEINVTHIRVIVPDRYSGEVMPLDLPMRREAAKGDPDHYSDYPGESIWDVTIDVDTGKIVGWNTDKEFVLDSVKVCDEGVYIAMDGDKVIKKLENDYVPGCIPGSYGDYIEMTIAPDGTIKEWAREFTKGTFKQSFFGEEDD